MASDIAWALEQLRAREADYTSYANYYKGEHKLTFATDKFRDAFGGLLAAFADNLCKTVVNTLADRLQVIGFASDTKQDSDGIGAAAWTIWQANRMDRRSGEVHIEALRCGDGYVIVWPGPDGAVRIHPQKASQMTIEYDTEEPGVVLKAAKAWQDNLKRWRLNLYYPDRIEKYATAIPATSTMASTYTEPLPWSEGNFTVLEVPGEPWPVPNPWGKVPVFHFANDADVGDLGQSELESVIPLQDGLNKSVCDMMVAMEFVALPQRWATGLEVELDDVTGKPKAPFIPGADRIWSVGDPNTKFGQFAAADLTQFIGVQENFRKEIGLVSRTPLHYIQPTSFPSGEAMKTAEEPLVNKAKDRAIAFGNVWEDAMGFALSIAGQGGKNLACLWRDPAPRNDLSSVEVQLRKKDLGVSEKQGLRELGYSDEQIEQMDAEKEEERKIIGETMLKQFDQDRLVGSEPGKKPEEDEDEAAAAKDRR
jgi:hypothetical protein